jgi:hypothetical protein
MSAFSLKKWKPWGTHYTRLHVTKEKLSYRPSRILYLRVDEGWWWLTIKQLLTNSRNTRWKHGHARTNRGSHCNRTHLWKLCLKRISESILNESNIGTGSSLEQNKYYGDQKYITLTKHWTLHIIQHKSIMPVAAILPNSWNWAFDI